MELQLSSNHRQQLLDWAKSAGDHECCGILRGQGTQIAALQFGNNVAADTARHFEIDPDVLISAHKDARAGGLPLMGYFHSHPNGCPEPSASDIAQAAPDGRFWLIIAAHEVTAWQPVASSGQVTGFTPVTLVVKG